MSDAREPRPKSGDLPSQTLEGSGRQRDMKLQPDTDLSTYKPAGKLLGKVALITGADSGIGRAVAAAFAAEGADVAVVYHTQDADAADTKALVEARGRKCLLVKADVRSRQACFDAVARTVKELGGLNVLVNNVTAQHGGGGSFEELTEDALRLMFDTNVFGYMFMTQAALPHLSAGDCVINTSSTTSILGHKQMVDYASTKGAVNVFTKSLAQQVADRGIRVNAVLPGPVWTPAIPASGSGEKAKTFGYQAMMGRPGQPEELAPAYVLLASADGSFMTGALVEVSGGFKQAD